MKQYLFQSQELQIPKKAYGESSIMNDFEKFLKKHYKFPSNNLKKIDDFAFWGCTSLEAVEVPKSVRVIGKKAFGGCTSLKEIRIPRWCWLKRGWKKDTNARIIRY